MNLRFADKVVVVTGASKGIGEATARLVHAEAAQVVLIDIDPLGAEIAEALGSQAYFINCDVSHSQAVQTTCQELKERYGRLDVWINNAGIQTYGTVTETSEDLWDHTLAVNLKSAYLCSRYAIPLLLQTETPVIINVASVQALLCQPGVAAYATAKAALLGLTRSIAVDYAPRLRCVAVCPGAVDTPMFRHDLPSGPEQNALIAETEQIHLLNRLATADEIARFIVFLASSDAQFMTGQYYRIDGGIGVKLGGQ